MNMQPERLSTQIATIIGDGQQNGKNYSGEKALLSCLTVLAPTQGERSNHELAEVVTVRTYGAKRGGGSRNYVSLWASGHGKYLAGHGQAGGWGYHRPSAAAQNAFESAGVNLSEAIDGRGETATEAAALALARALGYLGNLYIIRHG